MNKIVDMAGADISTPELTKEQRLDAWEAGLKADVDAMKDYAIQARAKTVEIEDGVVKAENRHSDFIWLRSQVGIE